MGTQIQAASSRRPTSAAHEGTNDHLSLTRPDLIETSTAPTWRPAPTTVKTNSFQSTRIRLEEWGGRTAGTSASCRLNLAAARDRPARLRRLRDARTAAPASSPARSARPACCLGHRRPDALGDRPSAQLAELFREQAGGAAGGRRRPAADRDQQDILETRAAVQGCRLAFADAGRRVPLQAQVALDVTGRMLLGTDIAAVADDPARRCARDVIGTNCSVGPEHLREPVRYLCAALRPAGRRDPERRPAAATSTARPSTRWAATRWREQLAAFVRDFGANVVGGCCGTTPEHIRAARGGRARADRRGGASRRVAAGRRQRDARRSPCDQEPRPLIVGERVNTQGSRRVKELLLADDYDGVLASAREQVECGAHALDVCVALTERTRRARADARARQAPVDGHRGAADDRHDSSRRPARARWRPTPAARSSTRSTWRTAATASRPTCRWRCEHGAAVVALTIDEEGMAQTAERKLRDRPQDLRHRRGRVRPARRRT